MSAEDTVLRHVHACRRMWNHFLALCVKKDAAVIHGDAETVAGIEETMRRVDRDLTTEERLLAVADKIERAGPKAWRSQSWASALVMALLLAAGAAWAQPVTPIQRGVLWNSTASATSGPASITITGITGLSVHIYSISARCMANGGGQGGHASMTIFNASTNAAVWQTGPQAVWSSLTQVNFVTPFSLPIGVGASIWLGSATGSGCGTNMIGILNVQADQY